MEGEPLITRYAHLFGDLKKLARAENHITENNIYQPANTKILKILDGMLEENVLPGSKITGLENIEKFIELVNSGKRGLILMEHYSNFDLPGVNYLLRQTGNKACIELSEKIVAIAGMKLSEEDPMVSAWAEGYNRIIIYPSRSLAAVTDPIKRAAEEERSKKINFASMRALDAARKRGQIILVFPAGTRYRPGQPETKRGVREIDSYLRLSDVMILISSNGNCLRISEDNPKNMMMDKVCKDLCLMHAGPVIECKSFRNDILATLDDYEGDKKQVVVDKIMELLEEMHNEKEKERAKLI
ncbi:MAG: 1-acyl-sn-glycerol-3-phosphate acyltransferase [Treponema sp.]|nr:1-acyl-sn-glycerol-3-phosphate acyltransferase [Treponema sp.]